MKIDPPEAGNLHCAEQSIASRADCLVSGHSRVVDMPGCVTAGLDPRG
ncbi:hypothetical protein [Enhydrobacter sp.]